jgi:hypothetical protein
MKVHKPAPKTHKSFWKGPLEDGITFSLLNRFLECRERFRLRVVEGLVDDDGFQKAMEYGSMWHESEAALATKGGSWLKAAQSYRDKLISKYPDSQADIIHWYCVLKAEFPHYITRWQAQHKANQSLLQEVAFRVPYTLPSGRVITLRGKWDQVFLRKKNIWLQENKTKGEIDEEGIMATVDENLQVMFYLIALDTYSKTPGILQLPGLIATAQDLFQGKKLAGVLYNVIRRPLADRYAIRQKKSETKKQFYERLSAEIKSKPDHYFKRWEANIGPADIKKFKRECFDPILEGLMDWWEYINTEGNPHDPWHVDTFYREQGMYVPKLHYRTPFGIYHSLAGGFRGSYFNYITKQSSRDLRTITTLYPELEE